RVYGVSAPLALLSFPTRRSSDLAPSRVRAVMAGGEGAVFRAVEGAEDDEQDGRRQGSALRPPDLLIGISASSVTPFVRGALAARSEEHTSELQSPDHLVCRLLLE